MAEKLLEPAALKVPSVISDLHGVTGRDIMDYLVAGERNPKTLARLARGTAKRKIPRLEEALEGAGFFTGVHTGLLSVMLVRIDHAAFRHPGSGRPRPARRPGYSGHRCRRWARRLRHTARGHARPRG